MLIESRGNPDYGKTLKLQKKKVAKVVRIAGKFIDIKLGFMYNNEIVKVSLFA